MIIPVCYAENNIQNTYIVTIIVIVIGVFIKIVIDKI